MDNLEVDDIAYINNFPYYIHTINENGIYVIDHTTGIISLIINEKSEYSMSEWSVFGYEENHIIWFVHIHKGLSNNYDVDMKIMLELDNNSLNALFCVNKQYSMIANDKYLWNKKINKEYGVIHLKLENETWKDQYEKLRSITNPAMAAYYRRIDSLTYFINKNTNMEDAMEVACEHSYMDIIDFLLSHNVEVKPKHMDNVTDINILKKLEFTRLVPPNSYLHRISGMGLLDILKYFHEKYNILPTQNALMVASKYGHLDIIQWLTSMMVFPDSIHANKAAIYNHPHILDYYDTINVRPSSQNNDVLYHVIKNGHLKMVIRLVNQYNIELTITHLNTSIRYEHIGITDWIVRIKHILPTRSSLDYVRKNYLRIFKRYEKYGILPTSKSANYALEKENINVLNWLFERNIYPEKRYINIYKGKIRKNHILKILLQRNGFDV